MIELIKKHKLLSSLFILVLIFDIFIATMALVPANKDVTTPGGLNEVKAVIEVDTDTTINGSFNTIYVYSLERVSILQSWVASLANYNEVSDSSQTIHLSDEERIKSGQVQKNQSIEASLICAYNHANKFNSNIKIDYQFIGYIISNYQINNEIFKIGDLITSVYDNSTNQTFDTSNIKELANAINNLSINDKISFIRDNEVKEVTIDKEFSNDNLNRFSCYQKYQINNENTYPSYKLHKSSTLGPSGGLLQTLSIYSKITGKDLTYGKKIVGTGTINVNGVAGIIGGISQKIVTAIHNNADVFLCPTDNYEEAYKTYMMTPGHEKMILLEIKTFAEAISKLGEIYEN